MSSWKAVLRDEGPVTPETVATRRELLHHRGIKKVRVSDDVAGHLRNLLRGSDLVTMSFSKHNMIWSLPNKTGSQHTIGAMEYQHGWRAMGWAAEHLICLSRHTHMPDIRAKQILKPRVRRLVLQHGSSCHFCDDPMPFSDLTVEHWLAKSLGGDSRPDNLRLAHRRCNELAGSLTIKQKNRLRYELKTNPKLRAELLRP